MNQPTSLYLDLVRFAAALVVFLGHAAGTRLTGGFLWQLGAYTGEAVAVFFVLSGFVIGYATDRRETTAGAYALARAARIYSVALPALVATFALDAAGRAVDPGLYNAGWGYVAHGQAGQFLSGLFFINRVWWAQVPQGSNLSYWSLGYEVWYYAIFGLAAFAPPRWRWLGAGAALLASGPAVASLFPLWLIGLGAYRLCARRVLPAGVGALLWGASLLAWLSYEVFARHHGRTTAFGASLARPELAQDFIVGICFAASLIGFRGVSPLIAATLAPYARPIRWVAGATFTLYLFHLPVAQCLAAFCQGVGHLPPRSWAARTVVIGGTLVAVFLAAEVTERRKDVWRRWFAATAARVGRARVPAAVP